MIISAKRRGAVAPLLLALLFCCTLASGGRAMAQSGSSQVEGFIIDDVIPDDLFGPGDGPLPGVTVTLRKAGGAPVATAVTGPDGRFVFAGVADGAYLVTETDPPGFGSVDAVSGTSGTTVDLNTVRINVSGLPTYAGTIFLDRAMVVPPAGPDIIKGSVFNDANGNGAIDLGEDPLPGVIITLWDAANRPIATRFTSPTGCFAFGGLADGSYTLVETNPAGSVSIAAVAGTGGQALGANMIRVTTSAGGVSYPGQLFLDRLLAPPAPAVSVTKTVDRSTAVPGDILTYTLFYSNNSGQLIPAATLFDPLPAATQLLGASGGGVLAGNTLTWSLGNLAPGSSGAVIIQVWVTGAAFMGGTIRNQAGVAAAGQGVIVMSNPVITSIAIPGTMGIFTGTYKRIDGATNPTSITVDPQNRFTVSTIPGDGVTLGEGAQGTLNPDGSFDTVGVNGRARFTGRIDLFGGATVAVQRAGLPSYVVTLPRAPDFNPLPLSLVGTFAGMGTNAAGDGLQVLLTIDPGGNSTFHADLTPVFPDLMFRTGSYQVTPDGRLGFGGQTDGLLQPLGGSLLLTYEFMGDNYDSTFQVPLVRQ
jgi:uncharacterized repeat protein (TIGR01451 family)